MARSRSEQIQYEVDAVVEQIMLHERGVSEVSLDNGVMGVPWGGIKAIKELGVYLNDSQQRHRLGRAVEQGKLKREKRHNVWRYWTPEGFEAMNARRTARQQARDEFEERKLTAANYLETQIRAVHAVRQSDGWVAVKLDWLETL